MKWSAETDLPFSTRETVALLIPIPLANSARLSSEATLTARRSRPKSRQLIPQVALLLGIRACRSNTYAGDRDRALSEVVGALEPVIQHRGQKTRDGASVVDVPEGHGE